MEAPGSCKNPCPKTKGRGKNGGKNVLIKQSPQRGATGPIVKGWPEEKERQKGGEDGLGKGSSKEEGPTRWGKVAPAPVYRLYAGQALAMGLTGNLYGVGEDEGAVRHACRPMNLGGSTFWSQEACFCT